MARVGPSHAYPTQLTSFLLARLEELASTANGQVPVVPLGLTLPEDEDVISSVLSVAYQASLLRDEDRPLTFRLAIAPPSAFPDEGGPPRAVHKLEFATPRPLAVHELKKLVPSVKFTRSLAAVFPLEDRNELWGVLHTGPRWLQSVRGGRGAAPELPSVLIVHVNGPGNLVVSLGSRTLARLYAGELTIPMLDVFDSRWLGATFAAVRGEVESLHRQWAQSRAGALAEVEGELVRRIAQNFVRRIISTIRGARHGGSVLIVPPARVPEILAGGVVDLKYTFADSEPRRRFRTLILSALRHLAERAGSSPSPLRWGDYEASHAPEIAEIDEAIMEMAYLVSGLADVDGLVVVTQRFEVLGFGGIVSGTLADVPTIMQAIDLEGHERVEEPTDGMGTRHRAAYRVASAMHDALCVVISQDGGVRFVRWFDDGVTVWDQVAASAFGG